MKIEIEKYDDLFISYLGNSTENNIAKMTYSLRHSDILRNKSEAEYRQYTLKLAKEMNKIHVKMTERNNRLMSLSDAEFILGFMSDVTYGSPEAEND